MFRLPTSCYCLFIVVMISCTAQKHTFRDAYVFSTHDYSKTYRNSNTSEIVELSNPERFQIGNSFTIAAQREGSAVHIEVYEKSIEMPDISRQSIVSKSNLPVLGNEVDEIPLQKRMFGKKLRKNTGMNSQSSAVAPQQIGRYFRIGTILGGTGVLAVIVGSLFSLSFLITIGVLMILGGIIYVVIDFL